MSEENETNSNSSEDETINILEMTAHFKEVVEKKEKEYRDLSKKHNRLFKTLIVCYSILKLTDDFLDQITFLEGDNAFKNIHRNIEWARSECSRHIHYYLPEESSESETE